MLRIWKSRGFARAARKEGVNDRALLAAAEEIEAGLVDAWLGGCLLKKRLARSGGGKRGGFRLIVTYRQQERLVFLFMFGKSERDNISGAEQRAMLVVGDAYVTTSDKQLAELVVDGELIEVSDDGG